MLLRWKYVTEAEKGRTSNARRGEAARAERSRARLQQPSHGCRDGGTIATVSGGGERGERRFR